ncbi:MAG TPA: nicotinate-nucleotide adenylyltransferase [Planktothrix sp.]|jgi:nicotinate-nucleotide adenylyltransferase
MPRLGLFCGTFNPIHNGHLLIAECAADQFKLDTVIFVTSPVPPHRQKGLLPADLRYELVEAAVADNSRFEASRLELDRSGPSYTVDTVLSVKQRCGDDPVYLVIGGDNLNSIHDWHKSDLLIANCHFLVAPRLVYRTVMVTNAGDKTDSAFLETVVEEEVAQKYQLPGAQVSIIDFPAVSISSSIVRARLSAGKSVLYMVPKPVHDILLRSGYASAEVQSNG